ncbi:MAG: polysaccharide biosynthesis protein, partial [Sphingomonadales bacterium]
PILMLIAVGASRGIGRWVLGGEYRDLLRRQFKRPVLIYGAGNAGRQLAGAVQTSGKLRVVGFIDDSASLHGSTISKLRVWPPSKLESLAEAHGIDEVILAIPSASRARRNEIIARLRKIGVRVRTIPGLLDLAHGRVTVSDLRPLAVDDLLGREAVAPDMALLERPITGRVVLVTGAGGSIGSELCRQIAAVGPTKLLLVESSEFALYAIHQELTRHQTESNGAVELIPLLASVTDETRMRQIFETWQPNTVYHAAAYKHVPLVEHNIVEGTRNNVLGTHVCASLAREFGATNFVLVSTDKAVRPTNVMGATKRAAELVLQALASDQQATQFAMVRFGNVLESSGSVVPLFRQQIAAGGPLTVTHRDVIRYFMTITEAAQLVLQAGGMAKGGEVFVLDMGEPIKIADLAQRMIELSGRRVRSESDPDGDIEIQVVGLRPGEKLYEELLIGENPTTTSHPRIMMAMESYLPFEQVDAEIAKLRAMVTRQESVLVREWLQQMVTGYTASPDIVDWTYLATNGGEAQVEAGVEAAAPVVESTLAKTQP